MEGALETSELERARNKLETANNIFTKLERQTQMIAILSRMKLKAETLTESIKNAFVSQWNEMVSVDGKDEEISLSVTENTEGTVLSFYSADGSVEHSNIEFKILRAPSPSHISSKHVTEDQIHSTSFNRRVHTHCTHDSLHL